MDGPGPGEAGLCLHRRLLPWWRGSAHLPTPRGRAISGSSGRRVVKHPAKKCTAEEYQQHLVTFSPTAAEFSPVTEQTGRPPWLLRDPPLTFRLLHFTTKY